MDNSFAPALNYVCNKKRVKFDGSCLKQDKMAYTYGEIVNLYIVYELSSNLHNFAFVLENCLFVASKLTKIVNIDKYKYSGYYIGFDLRRTLLFLSSIFGQNKIFGVDMSSSVHVKTREKILEVLGEGPTQGSDDTTLAAGKRYVV